MGERELKRCIPVAILLLQVLACNPDAGFGKFPWTEFGLQDTQGKGGVVFLLKFGEITCGSCLGAIERARATAEEAIQHGNPEKRLFLVVDPYEEDSSLVRAVLLKWAKAASWNIHITVARPGTFLSRGITKSTVIVVDSKGYIRFQGALPLGERKLSAFRAQLLD